MSYNKIVIIGNLGREPELRYTQAGKEVCSFSVATSYKWGENEETVWFKVVAWGKQGLNASKYLAKGKPVYVEGRLSIEKWTDRDGKERQDIVVNANEIQYLSSGDRGGGGGRNEHDQRRAGTDDHDQRQQPARQPAATPGDALPLSNDDIPF